jgi:hypothetical protein
VVYSKPEFGLLKLGSATSDFVLFITRTVCENRRLIEMNKRTV